MLPGMNLNQLTIFHAVAERLSFTRAAEDLHLTQPGISKHIAALEEYYGTRLFDRLGKRVSLTQAGEILHRATAGMVSLLREADARIEDLKGLAGGRLHLGAGVTIAAYLLPELLTRFRQQAPDVELAVQTAFGGQIVEQVLAATLELGLVGHYVPDQRLAVLPFLKEPLVLITSPQHRWAHEGSPVRPDQLAGETFLLSKRGSGTWRHVAAFLAEAGVTLSQTMELGTTEGVKRAVAADLGVSILSRHVLTGELSAGRVQEIPLVGGGPQRELSIVYRKDRYLSHPARAFLGLVSPVEEATRD